MGPDEVDAFCVHGVLFCRGETPYFRTAYRCAAGIAPVQPCEPKRKGANGSAWGALASATPIADHLAAWLAGQGLDRVSTLRGGATEAAVNFFRDHDLGFRIRRLRLLARRLSEDWADLESVPTEAREQARTAAYRALALYFDREGANSLGHDFGAIARQVFTDPGLVLETIANRRQLPATDLVVDALLVESLAQVPRDLRRRMMLTYLGFPFYDTVTLPLLRGDLGSEFEPAKVDRISPTDCTTIRGEHAGSVLRGTEFYNFGAFFSRAYRENDYLWGRLHGADRLIDIVCSTLPNPSPQADLAAVKGKIFKAILEEEASRLTNIPDLIASLRQEIVTRGLAKAEDCA